MPIEPKIAALILLAALMLAVWNALVKTSADGLSTLAAILMLRVLACVAALPLLPALDPASWVFLFLFTFLHLAYQLFLVLCSRVGDFNQVCPTARGAAPLVLSLLAAVAAGEVLSDADLAGVIIVSFGLFSLSAMATERGRNIGSRPSGPRGALLVIVSFMSRAHLEFGSCPLFRRWHPASAVWGLQPDRLFPPAEPNLT